LNAKCTHARIMYSFKRSRSQTVIRDKWTFREPCVTPNNSIKVTDSSHESHRALTQSLPKLFADSRCIGPRGRRWLFAFSLVVILLLNR
jgi:hypothetical protein